MHRKVTTEVTQAPWSLILHLIPIVTVAILAANGAPKVAIFTIVGNFLLFVVQSARHPKEHMCNYFSYTRSVLTGSALRLATLGVY
jgi:hypothetical protein